jgi:integrase
MPRDGRRDLPRGITPKVRKHGAKGVPVTAADGTQVYRVRLWDPVLKRQIERTAEGLDAAKQLLAEFNEAKRRPGRFQAERIRFADVAARYLVAYRVKRDGMPRPKSSLAKERTCLNVYILPALGNAWIGDLDLPELNATIRHLTLQDGSPASGSTKSTVASVLRRVFAWAREERLIPVNSALELRTGWGSSVRRRVIIPSIPQVLRLATALDRFKPGLGDVAVVLAFTGLRWEEAVAVPIGNISFDSQCVRIDRTASESGGRRDVREDMKTRAAERTVMIPDIAMPAVRRLADRGKPGRERSDGRLYGRLINGDRGGYLGYATWRKYLKFAQGYTAAHPDGIVSYTAHELRHVCASLLIASGATDMQVAYQMGHSRIETTKNIYGHLFAQDRASILDAMNQAVSRLYAYESQEPKADSEECATARPPRSGSLALRTVGPQSR